MSQLSASLLLLLTALIWGTAFVAQDVSTALVGTFTFNGIRFLIGAIVLLPFIARSRKNRTVCKAENKNLLKGGFLCGLALFSASSFQQYAMIGAGAGKAGFITSLYNIFTPLMMLAMGRKVSKKIFFYAVLSCVGMYFLSITSSFTIDSWDLYLIACAFLFALQIMLIDHYIKDLDGLELSAMQFLTVAILSLVIAIPMENIQLSSLKACAFPILYTGIFSCGIAYTLQVVAQKYVKPNIATLILSLESVFAAIAGFIILSDTLTGREIFGCAVVFISVLLAQLT
ncbi:MAG: DMT family transporter [Sphaerochaetaceae bacterium]|nr:DMT family transporter [Sphaerochaetaceae bacterium]